MGDVIYIRDVRPSFDCEISKLEVDCFKFRLFSIFMKNKDIRDFDSYKNLVSMGPKVLPDLVDYWHRNHLRGGVLGGLFIDIIGGEVEHLGRMLDGQHPRFIDGYLQYTAERLLVQDEQENYFED
ncbi:MAG: hypothetical protein IH845_04370 [Nanoarchaeota archaeon]|nr:hypothetical protein [Nanoarchaeota archaeon]